MFLERLFFEFIFICSLVFLVLFYLRLFMDVVKLRRANKISLGHGKNSKLERAVRAHANFIEYVPLSIMLSLVLYFHNFLFFSCLSIVLLIFGRVCHKKGITNDKEKNENFRFRRLGMRLTIYSFYSSILGLILYLGQTLYFFIKNHL